MQLIVYAPYIRLETCIKTEVMILKSRENTYIGWILILVTRMWTSRWKMKESRKRGDEFGYPNKGRQPPSVFSFF